MGVDHRQSFLACVRMVKAFGMNSKQAAETVAHFERRLNDLGPLPGQVLRADHHYQDEGLADAVRAYVVQERAAERDRCAALCLRPPGWLTPEQQAIATEIRNAILGNAGRLQGPNVRVEPA